MSSTVLSRATERSVAVLPGSPRPLGAVWDGSGVNFTLYSEGATAVELCVFDEGGRETRLPMTPLLDGAGVGGLVAIPVLHRAR